MKVISPLDGGGQEVILTLIQGGCNFILRPTLLILEPPLQIIIAQSLKSDVSVQTVAPNVCYDSFCFLVEFSAFFSEIILFITIINVQGIFSPSCRLKTLAMNRVEQIMTINNIFLRANTNQAALQPTVSITLKFVSTRNLASADRLTFCRPIRNAVCCESQGVDCRWFFPI